MHMRHKLQTENRATFSLAHNKQIFTKTTYYARRVQYSTVVQYSRVSPVLKKRTKTPEFRCIQNEAVLVGTVHTLRTEYIHTVHIHK